MYDKLCGKTGKYTAENAGNQKNRQIAYNGRGTCDKDCYDDLADIMCNGTEYAADPDLIDRYDLTEKEHQKIAGESAA